MQHNAPIKKCLKHQSDLKEEWLKLGVFPSALFPIIHLTTDVNMIRERVENTRKLSKSLVVGGASVGINQAVFSEQDQVFTVELLAKHFHF